MSDFQDFGVLVDQANGRLGDHHLEPPERQPACTLRAYDPVVRAAMRRGRRQPTPAVHVGLLCYAFSLFGFVIFAVLCGAGR